MTALVILSIVLVGLLAFSIGFRARIASLLRGTGLYAAGTWNMIWPVIGSTVTTALIVGGIGWLILILLMTDIGAYANSITAALIISILFPFWFVSMLIPRRTVPSPAKWRIPIFGIVRVFGGIVLVFASLLLAIGLWSPDTKGAINERSDDSKVWTANFFKKGSAHSERNAGVRGRVKSATKVFDEFNNPIEGIIPAGKIVMVLKNIQSKPATETREALLLVMLPDQHNNFVEGKKVWMPALKIEFISNEEQENSVSVEEKKPVASIKDPVAEVDQRRDPRYAECLKSGGECISFLSPGNYHLEPSARPGEVKFQLIEDKGLRDLGDGKNFTVPQGTKLVGIMSDQSRKILSGKI